MKLFTTGTRGAIARSSAAPACSPETTCAHKGFPTDPASQTVAVPTSAIHTAAGLEGTIIADPAAASFRISP